jgi:hypothetical protein
VSKQEFQDHWVKSLRPIEDTLHKLEACSLEKEFMALRMQSSTPSSSADKGASQLILRALIVP